MLSLGKCEFWNLLNMVCLGEEGEFQRSGRTKCMELGRCETHKTAGRETEVFTVLERTACTPLSCGPYEGTATLR